MKYVAAFALLLLVCACIAPSAAHSFGIFFALLAGMVLMQ